MLVALFGCESMGPVAAPETSADAGPSMVRDPVSGAEKPQPALGGRPGLSGPVSPLFYAVEQIPYVEGPRDLPGLMTLCDDCVLNDVEIGFPFTFYGNTYGTLQISSNGFVRFDPANDDSGCCSGRPIPLDDLWNNIIAFGWTDLIPIGDASGVIRFGTVGEAPNRRFILHADSVRNFGAPLAPPQNLSSWMVLHEGSSVIELHTEFWLPHSQVQTQGIENLDGTDAHFIPGRVSTLFTLTEDGVRFTPAIVNQVDLHDVYSGDPRQDPGTIHLEDEWVYVEVLDVEQYLPRPATADDVRIGPSWADGTPAESFQILDINMDGNRDIRVRWSLQQLRDDGHVTPDTRNIQVWGLDQQTGEFYRGDHEVEVIDPSVVLFDNCGFITHPGAGVGGADVSMSSPAALNIAGLNFRHFPPDPHFRAAEDFTVPAGGWEVERFVTYGYETGAATPNWTGFNLNVWDGQPGAAGSNIIATTTTASIAFTGVYRTFNGVLINTERPVHRISWEVGSLQLDPGTYWIDYQVQGGGSGWANMCMEPNPANPNAPFTTVGNARQLTPDGWMPTIDAERPGEPAAFPFLVVGPPNGAGLPVYRPADHGTPQTRPQPGRRPDARAADAAPN